MIGIMSELAAHLRGLSSGKRTLAVGEQLFRASEPIERLYLVLTGEIALERISNSGDRLILQRVRAGDIVAEASYFARHYHCDATSVTKSEVASVPRSHLEVASRSDPRLMEIFARHLAKELQQTRVRAEILSLHRVSDRLDAWLSLHDGVLPDKGRWLMLAHEIGITPEALYRELGRRRRSGV